MSENTGWGDTSLVSLGFPRWSNFHKCHIFTNVKFLQMSNFLTNVTLPFSPIELTLHIKHEILSM